MEEDPSRHAVEQDACEEDYGVQCGDDLASYEGLPGAGHVGGAGIHRSVIADVRPGKEVRRHSEGASGH